jgi:hypothetical protein
MQLKNSRKARSGREGNKKKAWSMGERGGSKEQRAKSIELKNFNL